MAKPTGAAAGAVGGPRRNLLHPVLHARAGAQAPGALGRLREHLGRLVHPPEHGRLPIARPRSGAASEPFLQWVPAHLPIPARPLLGDVAASGDEPRMLTAPDKRRPLDRPGGGLL